MNVDVRFFFWESVIASVVLTILLNLYFWFRRRK